MLEHPAITRTEQTGYPDGREDKAPVCPVCGGECDMIYKDKHNEIVGCDECIQTANAWEVM